MLVYSLHLADGAPRYVGMTKHSAEHRLRGHLASRNSSRTPVAKWIRSHGRDAIYVTILQEFDTEADMFVGEVDWIARLKADGADLLNVHPGGYYSGHKNATTESTRQKLRDSHLGKTLSPDQKAAISERFKGKPKSAEHREKLRQAALARGSRGGMSGRKHSPETIEKMRVAHLALPAQSKQGMKGRKRPDIAKLNRERAKKL